MGVHHERDADHSPLHLANISWVPGDFAGGYGVWPYNGQQGTTLNWSLNAYPYGSTVPQDPWIMPIEVGRTYYLNLMNMGCSPGEDTTMFLDLRIPA